MLVRCASCNKPVFVSGSAVSGGEAKIACKACKAELRVTAAGEVTLLSGGAAAPAAAAKLPSIAAPHVPQTPIAAPPAKPSALAPAAKRAAPVATAPAASATSVAALDLDLDLPPLGGPAASAAAMEPTQITLPPVAEVTVVGVQPAQAETVEPEPDSVDENTMIVPRPRAGQSAPIDLAPTDPAESIAAVRGPDPASYALGLSDLASADADDIAPPRRFLRVGLVAAGVAAAGVAGAWYVGVLRVPGVAPPGAETQRPVLAMDTPTPTPPPEPTPSPPEPKPVQDNGTVDEPSDDGEEEVAEEGGDDVKGKKKKKGKLSRPKPTKKSKKSAPADRPAPVASGGKADDHYQKASELLKEKKVPAAIDELKRAIGRDAKHAKSYRLLGMAYTLLGKEKNAVDAFERFVKLDPGHKDVPKVKTLIAEYYKRNSK